MESGTAIAAGGKLADREAILRSPATQVKTGAVRSLPGVGFGSERNESDIGA
jgi:hypothetical protein